MTLLFLEGFDLGRHKTYSERSYRYIFGTPTYSKPGRVVGYSVSWGTSSGPRWDTRSLSTSYQENLVLGFGFKADSIPASGSLSDYTGFRFERGSGNAQCILYIKREDDESVRWVLRNGSDLSTGSEVAESDPFDPRVWGYFEVKISVKSTGGSIEMLLHDEWGNSRTIMNTSSIDTAYQSSDGADILRFQGRSSPTFVGYFDDLYVASGTSYLGPQVIEGVLPNGAGASEDWSDSPSTSYNYENVDDPADSPSTAEYVYDDGTSSPVAKDLYEFEDPEYAKGDITGIEIETTACLDVVAGSESFHNQMRNSSGTESSGSSQTVTDNTLKAIREPFEQDPISSTDWTDAKLESFQWGIERE